MDGTLLQPGMTGGALVLLPVCSGSGRRSCPLRAAPRERVLWLALAVAGAMPPC